MSNTPEYYAWAAMKARCQNPSNDAFSDYGQRGIQVCARWESFENFYADMGNRPSPDHSLDRQNNDGNYEPNNCRWATSLEQNNNRRSTRPVDVAGQTYCGLAEVARSYRINSSTLESRIAKQGMTLEKAVSQPVGVEKFFEHDGFRLSLTEWSRKLGVPYQTLYARIHQHGWPLHRALAKKVGV